MGRKHQKHQNKSTTFFKYVHIHLFEDFIKYITWQMIKHMYDNS